VHGGATLIQRTGEFPAPLEHEYRISADAARYYKSGKGFVYRYLPFWLASLVGSRGGHPGADHRGADPRHATGAHDLRLARQEPHLPPLRGTDGLERAALAQPGPEERAELLKRLDEVERTVITAKMPGSVADQLYVLRQHITWVRERLAAGAAAPS